MEAAIHLAYGTVADWLAAVGTVGALIAAVVLLRQDRAILREQRDEKVRLQAQQIGTWLSSVDSTYRVHLKNASDLPIYNVTVEYGTPAGHDPWTSDISWTTVPPGETETFEVMSDASPTGAVILYWTRFTDSTGRSWQRGSAGDLEPVEDLEYVGCS